MRFSVTIPAYKRTYLKECIDSILAQTYTDFELIIVNDASPEDLDSIVNAYSDSRIRYYKNEKNCGAINVVDNWNICLSYATGDYVICMGDDDKLHPCCLEEYNKLINKYPEKKIYHAWTEIIDEDSNLIRMQDARPEIECVYSMILRRWKGCEQFIGDFLFETNYLKKKGGFYKLPLAWASDDISSIIAAQEFGIANSQVPIFKYRVNSQTISTSSNNQKIKIRAISLEEKWLKSFLKRKPIQKSEIIYTFWDMANNRLLKAMQHKRVEQLIKDFRSGGRIPKLLYWIINKENYNLNWSLILYSFLRSFII